MTHVLRLAAQGASVGAREDFLPDALAPAAQVMKSGGLVIVPTETVYGIAANALNEDAVKRVFEIKGRDSGMPLPVQVARASEVDNWVIDVPPSCRRLMEAFLPGPLTMILHKASSLPDLITGGRPTVGIRVPDHPVTACLLQACDFPLVMSSANVSGQPAVTTGGEACELFMNQVDLIIDGDGVPGYGCQSGIASTVIDLTRTPPKVLRRGTISLSELRQFLPEVVDEDEPPTP